MGDDDRLRLGHHGPSGSLYQCVRQFFFLFSREGLGTSASLLIGNGSWSGEVDNTRFWALV